MWCWAPETRLTKRYFCSQAEKFPDKVSVQIGFDAGLAQRIYAGTDFFLLPSRFEPCGLGQMIAVRYGSIPIVRRTGGLGDTISELHSHEGRGNGFVFDEYDSKALISALDRALAIYADPEELAESDMQRHALRFLDQEMRQLYESLYSEAVGRSNSQAVAA